MLFIDACKRGVIVVFLAFAVSAAARAPNGTLQLLRLPNNGIPAIVIPGGSFEALLGKQARIQLVNGEPGAAGLELSAEWTDVPGGTVKARCTVPENTPPGTYTLEARVGDEMDRNVRSVFVRASFPEYYLVAHLTDTHIGSPGNAAKNFAAALKAAEDSSAAFILITGDLTDGGEPEQFQQFIAILDSSALPTFVCPGNHDRKALHYEHFFGPGAYLFQFGQDGYLSFDTKDFIPADTLGEQDAQLEIFRRQIKGCRWSVGFTHRYESVMGMRSQIVLFADDPLDHLIFGHWHRANTEEERTVPWGGTRVTVTPATFDGNLRLFDVSAQGIKPREPENVGAAN